MIETLETPESITTRIGSLSWESDDHTLVRMAHQIPYQLTDTFNGLLGIEGRSSLVPVQFVKACNNEGVGELLAVSCTFVHKGDPTQAVQKLFVPLEVSEQGITVAYGLISPHESFSMMPPGNEPTQLHLQLAGQILNTLISE